MSIPQAQTTLTSIVDRLLESYDLDFLKEEYENNAFFMSVPFNDCKRHYIEYLLAMIAANSFQVIDKTLKLSPPRHVDVLWHSHILETSRYREFETIVLEEYCQSGRETNLHHLDHSVVDNKVGREERIKKTRGFYETLGFESLVSSKRELEASDEDDSSSKKLKATNQAADDVIEFCIEDNDGIRSNFKTRSTKKFQRAADKFAQRIGKQVNTLRFFNKQYSNERIFDNETVGQVFADDEEGTEHVVVALPEQLGC